MPHFTKEDLSVIKTCYEKNGWHGKRLVSEFPEKGWSPRSVNKAIRRLTTKGAIVRKKEKKRITTNGLTGKKKANSKTTAGTVEHKKKSTDCSETQFDKAR